MTDAATLDEGPVHIEDMASMLDVPAEEAEKPAKAEKPEAEEVEAGEGAADDDSESEEDDGGEAEDDSDDAEDEDTEESDAKEPMFTVKVDGKEYQVTQSEVIAGYQRQADYSRKTQDLANQRDAVEQEKVAVQETRAYYVNVLNALEQQIFSQSGQEPDWDKLREEDPVEYSVRMADWQRQQHNRSQAIERIRQERDALMWQQAQEAEAARQQYIASEQERLFDAVPEWRNHDVMSKEMDGIVSYLRKIGYSDEELSQAIDHRSYIAARDAYRYRQMKAKSGEVKQKAAEAPKMAKPGAKKSVRSLSRQERRERAYKRYEASGDVGDLASLLDK